MVTDRYEPSPNEIIDMLLRRQSLVEFLARTGRTKAELQEELDLPKSTMYKATRELEEVGMVERVGDTYQLTQFGGTILRTYRSLLDTMGRICEGANLLLSLPADCSIDPKIFEDAELFFPEPMDPDKPIDTFEDLIRGADELHGFAPVTRTRYVELFYELFEKDAIDAEIIIDESVYEYVLNNFRDRFVEEVSSEASLFRLYDGQFPFGLTILEGEEPRVIVNFYDRNNHLLGIIVSRNEQARTWASSVFESYRTQSSVIEADEL